MIEPSKISKELPSPEIQVALATLDAIGHLATEFSYLRKMGFELTIPQEVENEYVKEYGIKGQDFLDILLGRQETIASVNVKVRMKLED